ncbi:MAG: hypothetical protein LBC27_05480 [Spirochaetaceae bacterium]|jgi:hypothetical protein|nr:hypothetical protein [Spirochaetaceae bacterium]
MLSAQEIYSKLYDITSSNMLDANGTQLSFSKDVFMLSSEYGYGTFDAAKASYLDNKSFYYAAYIGLMKRYPDELGIANFLNVNWKLPKRIFQEKLIKGVMDSREYSIKKGKLINNIYSFDTLIGAALVPLRKDSFKTTIKHKLYNLYISLPAPLKKFCKKIYLALQREFRKK